MMHVICAADRHYGMYAGIMLSSLIRSTTEKVGIHLLSDGIEPGDIDKISAMAEKAGGTCTAYDIKERLDNLSFANTTFGHISRATFGRILANHILPADIGHYLYLDCDVVVKSDVGRLWSTRHDVPAIAAVGDIWLDSDAQHKSTIDFDAADPYFNAGVLLINAQSWREEMTECNVADIFRQHPRIRFLDQDVINIAFKGRVRQLPRAWNTLVTTPDAAEDIDRTLRDASIIHYASGLKPWHAFYGRLGGRGHRYYLDEKSRSPWRFALPDFHQRRVMRKARGLVKRFA